MSIDTLGIDIAKTAFQLQGVSAGGGVVLQRRIMRDQLPVVLAQIERCTMAIEAPVPSAGHASPKRSATG